jgi:hypothetical protein
MEIYISTHCYNRFKKTQTLAIKFGRILVYNRLKLNQTTTALVIVPSINIDGCANCKEISRACKGRKVSELPTLVQNANVGKSDVMVDIGSVLDVGLQSR